MTNNFRALCADLIEAVLSDDSHIDCTEIARRARAALADGPAVPKDREPAAVTGQPSDGEVAELVETLKGIAYWRRHGKPGEPAPTSFDIRQADRLDRAAELLERLSPPQPVPVSEQWPEFSDCDDADRVWCWSWAIGTWRLSRINQSIHTHWLPAHALPVPEVGE